MELTTLKFSTDTTELDTAVTKLNEVSEALARLGQEASKPIPGTSGGKGAPSIPVIPPELPENTNKATKLLERLKNTHGDLVAGFTKGESSILNQARAYGMAGDALNPFMDQLKLLKELTKDPFDASIGAIRSVQQEFDKLQQRGTLAAQGISLTTKQLEEYSRLASEVKGKVIQMGIDPASVDGQAKMNTMLATAQKEYLGIAQKVNSLVADEKALNKILQDQEAMFRAISNERMKEYANSIGKTSEGILQLREQYSALEAESNRVVAANEKVANSIDHINQVAALMKQGMSKGEATQRVNLLGQGVTAENIDKLIAANKQLESSTGGATKGLDAQAKAAEWAARELARAEHVVESFADTLKTSTSNKLFKFNEMLTKGGFSEAEATSMMEKYRVALGQGQDKANEQTKKKMRDLARDVSVQMGDVFVSLAGGMNPFMVMIQQGDQLRGAFDKTTLSAEETKKAMLQASAQIAQGFVATGKAIGTFLVGALQATGGEILKLVTGPVTAMIDSFAIARKEGLDLGQSLTSAMKNSAAAFGTAALSSFAVLATGAAVALGVLAYQMYKTAKAEDAMTKQLALTGAALGMNRDAVIDYANSLEGVSSGKTVAVFTAMAKEGGIFREEAMKITPVINDMMKYLGVTAEQAVNSFSKLKDDPVKALMQLSVETGKVNSEIIVQVRNLEQQGKKYEAMALATTEWARANGEAAKSVKGDLSDIGKALLFVTEQYDKLIGQVQKLARAPTAKESIIKQIEDTEEYIKQRKAINAFGIFDKDIASSEKYAESLRRRLGLMNKVSDAESKVQENTARGNEALSELSKRSESLANPVIKYGKELDKVKQQLKDVRTAYGAGSKEYMQAALDAAEIETELNEKIKDYVKKKNKPDADAEKIRKAFEADLKRLNDLRLQSLGVVEHLTNAEIAYNQILEKADYSKYSPARKKELEDNMKLARSAEMQANAEKEKIKAYAATSKIMDEADKIAENFWNTQVDLSVAVNEETESLMLQQSLIGSTNVERIKAIETQKAQLQLEKELAAIRSSKATQEDKDIASQQAMDRFQQRMQNINRKIAVDLTQQLSDVFDKGGSFEKSAERFASALKDAGKTSFANLISSLGKVSGIMENLAVQQEQFNKLKKEANGKNLEKIQIENAKNQLKSYGDLTAAAKGFFKEGTTGYKALQKAEQVFRAFEMALAVKTAAVKIAENAKVVFASVAGEQTKATAAVTGASQEIAAQQGVNATKATAAVINQGGGDPYSAFVRVAAMAAIMAGLGYAVSGGGGSAPTAPTNQGTGTVFGGAKDDKSKSVANSLKILEEVDTWTMRYSAQMLDSLRSIEKQIGGVTNLVLRSGTDTLKNQASGVQTGTKMSFLDDMLGSGALITLGAMLAGPIGAAIGALVSKIPIVSKAISALFGTKTSITGQGIYTSDTTASQLANSGVDAGYYTDTKNTKKFLGITTSTSYSTQNTQSSELSNQFTMILQSFVNSVKLAGKPLGIALDQIDENLANFVISIGRIDIQGLTGEQIQEKLAAVFGAAGDKIAQAAIPGLEKFQQVGEGYFETLVRVATSVETVTSWFDTLGYALTGLNIDRAMGLVDLFGDLDTLNSSLSDYYNEFYLESEKTAKATQQMTKVLGDLGIAMPTTRLQFRLEIEKALADGNDELAATLLKLSPAIASIIPAFEETGRTAEDIASSITDMQTTLKELNIDLLNAQGRTEEAKAAFRALSTEGMTPAEIATWDAIQAMKAQIEATNALSQAEQKRTNEALTLQGRIDQLQGNTAAIRERELAALDPANRELQLFIYSLEDLAKATADAKAAAEAIAQENYGLQTELLTLQGNTAELRKRELALLDPSNRALKQEIYDLQDKIAADKSAADAADEKARAEKEAADAATRAAEEQIQAAEQLKQAWQSITDTIYEEVARIRGLAGTDKANLANAQSNFDIATAKARAGDQEAAKMLPELSKTLLDLAGQQAVSLVSLRRIQMLTAASLEQTANGLASSYGLTIPAFASGGNYSGGLALVGEQGPELINFNKSGTVYNANQTSSMMNSNIESLIAKLNENIEGLRYEVRAGVTHSAKTAKLLNRVIKNADTISVSFDDPQKVTVV